MTNQHCGKCPYWALCPGSPRAIDGQLIDGCPLDGPVPAVARALYWCNPALFFRALRSDLSGLGSAPIGPREP